MESTNGGATPGDGPGDAARADLLLVDNDARIVELVQWFLTERGFTVRTAESFAAARDRLAERRPDLLISDVDLGGESATTELPRLHDEGVLPPTLVVSGYLDHAVKLALLDVPEVRATLAKPFEFPDLEEKIDACLADAGARQPDAGVVVPQAPPAPDATREAPSPPAAEAPARDETQPDEDGWIEITPRS